MSVATPLPRMHLPLLAIHPIVFTSSNISPFLKFQNQSSYNNSHGPTLFLTIGLSVYLYPNHAAIWSCQLKEIMIICIFHFLAARE